MDATAHTSRPHLPHLGLFSPGRRRCRIRSQARFPKALHTCPLIHGTVRLGPCTQAAVSWGTKRPHPGVLGICHPQQPLLMPLTTGLVLSRHPHPRLRSGRPSRHAERVRCLHEGGSHELVPQPPCGSHREHRCLCPMRMLTAFLAVARGTEAGVNGRLTELQAVPALLKPRCWAAETGLAVVHLYRREVKSNSLSLVPRPDELRQHTPPPCVHGHDLWFGAPGHRLGGQLLRQEPRLLPGGARGYFRSRCRTAERPPTVAN